MLRMMRLPQDNHEALEPTPERIESVQQVLNRHNPSSLYYTAMLILLSLSPYATLRKP
jgi:hypothetical protein